MNAWEEMLTARKMIHVSHVKSSLGWYLASALRICAPARARG